MTLPEGTMRLDKLMTERGLAASRERVQLLIGNGLVLVNGEQAEKASQPVAIDAEIAVTGEVLRYVGRGGLKLEAALRGLRLNVREARCLDVGASTGGFTDCLLQRGATHVTAVDVGHSQLAASLKADPRVELREGVNARYLSPEQFPELFDFATVDVSFISLTLVLPAVAPLVRPGGHILALVKPEFEAGREAVGARGIVRSPEARRGAVQRVIVAARDELRLEIRATFAAPHVPGTNRETFLCMRKPGEAAPAEPEEAETERAEAS
jgi:23S rRNA (cytidine1920-2'-O)/16S rRNA (cytidine1409-2'-O)-methyltransferase